MKRKVRIGNAGGYWGDDLSVLKRQLTGGKLDYITMDFLAEITMSILQRQRKQNPDLGYAVDFLQQLDDCLPLICKKKVRVITNAGGINPLGMGRAVIKMAQKKGLALKVGIVYGDDISDKLYELTAAGEKFENMDTGENFLDVRSRISTANIYLGAEPVVKALEEGCHIVVCGRVTDTGITLAPMIHELGWAMDDWDRLAAGIIASHIIECGAQASGGNLTDWQEVKSYHNIGYPIIEMESSGEFVVTKHPRTGGVISEKSIKEQLVYEMGDPANFITPDGIARFDTARVKQDGKDRVRVTGIKGRPEPEYLKVSMSYEDGWKSSGMILVSGPDTYKKADAIADIFWKKLDYEFEETRTEVLGSGSIWPPELSSDESNEVLLRFSVRDHDYDKVRQFGIAMPTLILSGPAGMAVTTGGRPKPKQVIAYWPALIHRSRVKAKMLCICTDGEEKFSEIHFPTRLGQYAEIIDTRPEAKIRPRFGKREKAVTLRDLCYARSGDKGDTCNIGVLARSPKIYEWLVYHLTAQRVKKSFGDKVKGEVERYRLDNLHGLNFLLHKTLGGGGTRSLMIDPQGKTLSQALLQMKIKVPRSIIPKRSKKR